MGLIIKAPAKINLTLDVLARRPDGYHEVEMVMQSIDLYDTLEMHPQAEEISLSNTGIPVTIGDDNLIFKAARLLQRVTGAKHGAKINLHKEIPVAAGMAGGSTDAAAALRGLNELWQLGLSQEQLISLAGQLGADVPFCLLGGTAIARGIGEKLTPLPTAPSFGVVLIKPSFGVSTAEVYGGLDLTKLGPRPDTSTVTQALQRGELQTVADGLCNVLESVTLKLYPELRSLKGKLVAAGCQGSLMSGSGPTLFGLTQNAERAAEIAKGLDLPDCRVIATQLL